jgi:hypothetical protein
MRPRTVVAGVVAGLAATPNPAWARDPLRVEPASQWVLDYADEHCSLARTFGSGDTAATLRISSYGSWNSFETFLTGPLVPHAIAPYGSVRIAFPSDSEQRDLVWALKGTAGDTSAVSFPIYFGPYNPWYKGRQLHDEDKARLTLEQDRPYPEFDRKTDGITLDFDNAPPIYLHLQDMAAPLAALRACVDDLYKSWKLDPTVQKALSRRAKPLPLTVAEIQRHYPVAQLGKQKNGYVRVRLKLDATGQPTACAIQDEPADEAFRKATCDHLTGDFDPALDKDGHPVETVYFTSIVFLGG